MRVSDRAWIPLALLVSCCLSRAWYADAASVPDLPNLPGDAENGDRDRIYDVNSDKGNDVSSGSRDEVNDQFQMTNASEPPEKETLVHILVEIQKRADVRFGYHHTVEEEATVDYFFEDDIMLTVDQAEEILQDLSPRRKRKLAEPLSKRWELPIPYAFDGSHSEAEKWRIKMALAYWQDLTCITFREMEHAENKLLFVKGRGCWSYVGYTHQVNQTISIGDGCQSNGTIAHEVGHAIGFWHEQSRPDRDDLVIIHQENVTAGKLYNFAKRTWGEIITLGVPYDLGSDMHYGSKFYASDANSSLLTVETRDALMARVIGQRQELSFYDVKLANKAYCDADCSSRNIQLSQPCMQDGYQDPRQCTRCRCPDGFMGDYCETVSPGKNAYCGGALFAQYNGTIVSPGYPVRGYGTAVECSWLIKAPSGNHVYLEFLGIFGISGHVDVCKDFVEVRYNTSLALTGARFCCDDPPRSAIRSDSNEMLVLFRSFEESRVCDDIKYPWKCRLIYIGFAAKYYTKSCGGCVNYLSREQPACKRRVSYTCSQSWTEQVQTSCSLWWYANGCGPRTVTKVRYATCYRDEYYCCDRYVLDGQVCRALSNNHKRSFDDEQSADLPQVGGELVESTLITRRPMMMAWSAWGSWGRCSRSCGGGVRVRRRHCLLPGVCGHEKMQLDKETCAENVCYKICQSARFELCDFWIQCKRTTYSICDRYCADGYTLEDGNCVAQAS